MLMDIIVGMFSYQADTNTHLHKLYIKLMMLCNSRMGMCIIYINHKVKLCLFYHMCKRHIYQEQNNHSHLYSLCYSKCRVKCILYTGFGCNIHYMVRDKEYTKMQSLYTMSCCTVMYKYCHQDNQSSKRDNLQQMYIICMVVSIVCMYY